MEFPLMKKYLHPLVHSELDIMQKGQRKRRALAFKRPTNVEHTTYALDGNVPTDMNCEK